VIQGGRLIQALLLLAQVTGEGKKERKKKGGDVGSERRLTLRNEDISPIYPTAESQKKGKEEAEKAVVVASNSFFGRRHFVPLSGKI